MQIVEAPAEEAFGTGSSSRFAGMRFVSTPRPDPNPLYGMVTTEALEYTRAELLQREKGRDDD